MVIAIPLGCPKKRQPSGLVMRTNRLVTLILGIFFTLGIAFSLPAAAKLYNKWVDENGTTHYGETIPPEYADKDRAELNKAGRVVKKQDVLTPEERRAARNAKEQEEANQLAEEKAAPGEETP